MILSQPTGKPAATIGLAVLTGGLWLGLVTAIAPAAHADRGAGTASSDHARPDRTSAGRQSGSGAAGGAGATPSSHDHNGATGGDPGADGQGTRVSKPGGDVARPTGVRSSDGLAKFSGIDDAAGAARSGAPGQFRQSRRLDRGIGTSRPAAPARSLERLTGDGVQRGQALRAAVGTDDPQQGPRPSAPDPAPVSAVETTPVQTLTSVDAIAEIPAVLASNTATALSTASGSFAEKAQARGREFMAALTARVPGAQTQRMQNAATPINSVAEVVDVVRDGVDSVVNPARSGDLARVEATPSTAALTKLTAQLRTLAGDTAQELHFMAVGTQATVVGVGSSLRQGVDTLADAQKVGPVDVIGSLAFAVLGAFMQILSGPAVVPLGSKVTARTSTLVLPDSGTEVRADWYFPENANESTRLIYLQHGFFATGPLYSYTAAYLAESTDSIVVAPTMSWNSFDPNGESLGGAALQQEVAALFAGDRPELTASAREAGYTGTLPEQFVLVGHSLGGALVMGAADRMDPATLANLKGVVLLDAVDSNNAVADGLVRLSGDDYRPVLNISSEPYIWNLDGTVATELQAARPTDFNGVMLVGGRHIDAAQGGNPVFQVIEYALAGLSKPANVAAVQTLSSSWIDDMFDGIAPSYDPNGPATAKPLAEAAGKTVSPLTSVKMIVDSWLTFAG